jgi:acetyltransferase
MRQLERVLIAFSNLMMQQQWIKECDINPLLASGNQIIALDARIVVHPQHVQPHEIPKPAIRPYPAEYIHKVALTDGTPVTLRPIRLEDEPWMVKFHESLSEESVRRRYFQLMNVRHRTDHNRLIRVCYNDYDRELAIVAEVHSNVPEERVIAGVARLSRDRGARFAEFAIVISDEWQGRGLGTQLLSHLVHVGRREDLTRVVGHLLPDNWPMQALCKRVGFHLTHDVDEVRAVFEL